ncbi:Rts3p LALA0_S08e06436g [Lachancea lanzarotensis]|uniref:LALA0S08e06436g1_1 n=1 Tax=Lachancea lanzarotensis TaxID=1245769 RepID=A0A0C7N0F3_9SACH|nr:uncharacterized protein LALA0_S08e06436g [Lachancea lanzarotensis]CEP63606.1 LALA0S08e06436g1_1 [Lachancea lanzarotensis]
MEPKTEVKMESKIKARTEPKSPVKGVTLYRERFNFGEKPRIVTSDAAVVEEPPYSTDTKTQPETTRDSGNKHYTHMTTTTAAVAAATSFSDPRNETSVSMSSFSPATRSGIPSRPSLPAHTPWSSSSSLSSINSNTRGGNMTRRLSSEEIINEMEKEQDAIVVRLLREIDQLKDENNRLRKNLCAVLNGEPHTAIHTANTTSTTNTIAPHTSLPQLSSRRSSLSSNASSVNNNNSNLTSCATITSSLAGSSVLAMRPNGTSPVPSRRPSSCAAPIDTVTPTLLLQRKRNSVPSPVPLTPKKSDEFAHLYAPVPTSKSYAVPEAPVDLTGGSGFRRRRSSMKASEGSNKIPRSTQ